MPLPDGHLGSHGSLPPGITERREEEEPDALTSDAMYAEGYSVDEHFEDGICPFCDEDETTEEERTFKSRQGAMTHARQRHEYEYGKWREQVEDDEEA